MHRPKPHTTPSGRRRKPATIKVRLLSSMAGENFVFHRGQVIECSLEAGKRLIRWRGPSGLRAGVRAPAGAPVDGKLPDGPSKKELSRLERLRRERHRRQVEQLGVDDLERIARRILTRDFGRLRKRRPKDVRNMEVLERARAVAWNASKVEAPHQQGAPDELEQVVEGREALLDIEKLLTSWDVDFLGISRPAHGGKAPLTPAWPWSILEPKDDNGSMGGLVSELVERKNRSGRLLCELARLRARALVREAARAREEALQRERSNWEQSGEYLSHEGERRRDKRLKEIKDHQLPDYIELISEALARWGLYASTPSREAMSRWAARMTDDEMYTEILKLHELSKRPYRVVPHTDTKK